MFAILGCLRISDKAVETAGPVFSVVIGLGIALYGVGSFDATILGSVLRLAGGAAMIALGVVGYSVTSRQEAH